LEAEVESIVKTDNGFAVTAGGKTIETKYVINAAGTEAGIVHDMVLPHTFEILPNKGEYYLLDKSEGTRTKHVVFQCPTKVGKGVLVAPTVHGNLIVGPNAVDCAAGDTSTAADDLAYVRSMAVKSVPTIDFRQNIRNFAGVRPNSTIDDFIIEAHDGFFDVAGIKSPGLASAAGIAEYVEEMMRSNGVALTKKAEYTDTRTQPRFKEMTHEERAAIVKKDPKFGRVICRCETITEGEILDSIHRPIVPRTVDAIKRRCCAGMGRCQGGFCGPRVVEILARELGVSRQDIDKDKTGSYIVRERED
jgi:glycerol-3-phosphate dehydrogenase